MRNQQPVPSRRHVPSFVTTGNRLHRYLSSISARHVSSIYLGRVVAADLRRLLTGKTGRFVRLMLSLQLLISLTLSPLQGFQRLIAVDGLEVATGLRMPIAQASTLTSSSTDVFRGITALDGPGWDCISYDLTLANDGDDGSVWNVDCGSNFDVPFWQIDLGFALPVDLIKIHQDNTYYAHNLVVQGSVDGAEESWVGLAAVTTSGGWSDIVLPTRSSYRYYKIAATDFNVWGITDWSVYSIEAYTGEAPFPPPPSDIFRGNTSVSGAEFNCTHNSNTKVNDGNDFSVWQAHCAGVELPFWSINLGYSAVLTKIRLFQEEDFNGINGAYAATFSVQGSSNGTTWTNVVASVTGTGGWQDVTITSTTPYRYYRIALLTYNTGRAGYWRVHTIQGFGYYAPASDEIQVPNPSFRNECRGDCGAPVNTATGNFWHTFSDLGVPGRSIPLQFGRTYSSLSSAISTTLGYGWIHNYDMYIKASGNDYVVHQENGAVVRFKNTDFSHAPWVSAELSQAANASFIFTRTEGLDRFYFKPLTDTVAPGKLYQIVDRNGYTTSLSYNATSGLLETVTEPAPASRQLSFSYTITNSVAYLTQVTDPANRSVHFGYDANGNLETATDVGNQTMAIEYYPGTHLLKKMHDPNGGELTNEYDGNNRATKQTDPMGRQLRFDYLNGASGTSNVTSTVLITDSLGLVTKHYYNDNRLIRSVRNPGSTGGEAVTDFSYKPGTTWLESITDPNGRRSTFTWDAAGNLKSTTDPLARTTQFVYNATNDLVVVTDTRGYSTTIAYDTGGNPLSVTRLLTDTTHSAYPVSTSFTYDPLRAGDLLTVTNPLGKSWGYQYDQYGNVITTTNPLNEPPATFQYNTVGWLTNMTTPRGYTASYSYTEFGEPYIITDTLGYATTYSYDNVGNLLHVTDANGRTITNTYNLNNELTQAKRPDGTHSDYQYDAAGRVLTQTNPLAQSTYYTYDDVNRVITYTDALSRKTTYRYDLAGTLTSVTDAKGMTTTPSYDAAYQLKSVDYSDPNTPDVQYDYNAVGARTIMTDGTGTTTYTYDSLLRPTSITNGNSKVVDYEYDLASRPITITYPYQSGGSGTNKVVRGYDDANRLTSVKDWLTNITTFEYNYDGALKKITRPNNTVTDLGYDAADQVISMTHSLNGTPFLSYTYVPDPVGVLSATTEVNTLGSGGAAGSRAYSYDQLYRLTGDTYGATSPSVPTTNTWQYDGATQIVTATYEASGGGGLVVNTRTYDAANQLHLFQEKQGSTWLKQYQYTFDNNGNRTKKSDKLNKVDYTYGYDQVDRLTSYNNVYTYAYNGDGLRMRKTIGETDKFFQWDIGVQAGLPLLLNDQSASYIYGPGGLLLEEIIPGGILFGDSVYYYHTDKLGSVRALTYQSGAAANTYTYDAYGQKLSSSEAVANPFGYTGEYTDQETGFIYLRARYYDPESQQFLTVDPALAWTEQAYAYVGGGPTNFTDPSGLCDAACVVAVAGTAGLAGVAAPVVVVGGAVVITVVGVVVFVPWYADQLAHEEQTRQAQLESLRQQNRLATASRAPQPALPTTVASKKVKPTSLDASCDTEDEALDEALRRNNAPPAAENAIEKQQVYGKNPNLRGPNGEPWERIHALDVEGNTITIDNHRWGHTFEDGTEEDPHFHGPKGEHIFYP